MSGNRPPGWVIASAHRKADATLRDHAVVFIISNCGFGSDPWGAAWYALPDNHPYFDEHEDKWLTAPYVAIPGELA